MKILPFGVAVLDNDTHISKWVEELKTLRIATEELRPFKKYVPSGGVVIDIGANIGDHTLTYSDWVGSNGYVFAFEPNPKAYECLKYNCAYNNRIATICVGLSDKIGTASLIESDNVGASHMSDTSGDVETTVLDVYEFCNINFVKIDVEGYETKVLHGAKNTIALNKPTMLIEVNEGALIRSGSSVNELLRLVKSYGYHITITDQTLSFNSPQYDILCVPNKKPTSLLQLAGS